MRIVQSNLKLLVVLKEIRERRRLSVRVIVAESGASRSTVERLMNNTIKRVPLDDLGALCRYLGCDVGDVLRMEETGEEHSSP